VYRAEVAELADARGSGPRTRKGVGVRVPSSAPGILANPFKSSNTELRVLWKKALWQVWRWDFLAEVRIQEGEPLENALRRFKRKVQQEDIIKEVKRHSYYLKPGEKKRVKAALARKRNRKKARKEQD
jgi:small subunit ribosomal protein S21